MVVKDDYQKADDAAAPTHLWSFFFRESFLDRFQKERGRPGPWQFNNVDVCQRHPWDRQDGMPPGWVGSGHERFLEDWSVMVETKLASHLSLVAGDIVSGGEP